MVSGFAKLTEELNRAVSKSDLVPLLQATEEEKEALSVSFPDLEQVREICKKYGVDANHLYAIKNHVMSAFCYWNYPVFISIDLFSEQYWDMMHIQQRIEQATKEFAEALEGDDCYKIFAYSEERAKFLILDVMYWRTPEEKRFELYKEVYTYQDYGHASISREIQKDVWKHQPDDEKARVRKFLDRLSPGETITVYRGEGSGSTPHYEAMSWTTSLTVAGFFATRIRSDLNSIAYRATVKKLDILDFDDSRNEKEVLLFPDALIDVQKMPMTLLIDEWNQLIEEGYMEEYHLYKNTFIKDEHYKHPNGIHGVGHVKRVLFHAITLSRALGLSGADRAILANAAVYHDIGRKHDGHCTMHGEWSWNQYVKTIQNEMSLFSVNCVVKRQEGEEGYDLNLLTKEEAQIVQFLVEYHCRDDEEGERALRKMHLHSKARERYWRLFLIFKDCDGLDRVRLPLNELDVKYFRTEEAKNRLLYAFQVKNQDSKL